ncbi:indole-3-glycerol phosphate synthase [Dehalogenimonas sp. WBC-2]|nr:indole-3-glycerol phosphate synthase [Dehalogenimonas sp. WBC-2]
MLLDDILKATQVSVKERQKIMPLDDVIAAIDAVPPPVDFARAISGQRMSVIAEVKKASPSRGVIKVNFDPVSIARAYVRGGAAAISVLTEEHYFQGSIDYLRAVSADLGGKRPPILRKDFIFEPYQIYEARVYGADAVLLIVSILTPTYLASLLDITHDLGMMALVEAHDEEEVMTAVNSGAQVIGINNRDLKTFAVDIKTTARLRPLIPRDRTVVSESGICCRSDLEYLSGIGVQAALIGEALVTADDIEQRLREVLA